MLLTRTDYCVSVTDLYVSVTDTRATPASSPRAPTTNELLALVQGRIRENAARYFPQFAGYRVSVRCTRLRAGSNPLYCCALHPDNGSLPSAELVIKFAPKPLRIEFDNLSLLYENRHDTPHGLLAPRPLDYFADLNALLTEKVGGQPLTRLVLRKLHVFASHTAREAIAERMRLCGKWLAHYHQLTRRPDAAPFDDRWMKRISRDTRDLEDLHLPPPVIEAARTTLSQLTEFRTHHLAPYAYKHGDFGFHNVHAGKDWVCVFDLNDHRPVCVYEDLARFLVTLETKNNWPRYPLFDRRLAAAMKTHFVNGYFESTQERSPVLLEGYALTHLLIHCAKQRRRVAARSRQLLPLFDAFRLRRFYAPRVLTQCALVDQLLSDEVDRTPVARHA